MTDAPVIRPTDTHRLNGRVHGRVHTHSAGRERLAGSIPAQPAPKLRARGRHQEVGHLSELPLSHLHKRGCFERFFMRSRRFFPQRPELLRRDVERPRVSQPGECDAVVHAMSVCLFVCLSAICVRAYVCPCVLCLASLLSIVSLLSLLSFLCLLCLSSLVSLVSLLFLFSLSLSLSSCGTHRSVLIASDLPARLRAVLRSHTPAGQPLHLLRRDRPYPGRPGQASRLHLLRRRRRECGKIPPLACVPTAFAAKTLYFSSFVLLPSWLRHCLWLVFPLPG